MTTRGRARPTSSNLLGMAFLVKLLPWVIGLVKLLVEAVAQSVIVDWVMKKLARKKRR